MSDEWAVNTPNGQVRLADFTLSTLVEIETGADEQWFVVMSHPFRSAKSAQVVYRAACALTESEPAEITMRNITEIFVQVPEDMPDIYEGSNPKAVEDPPTAG
jgi:hypothetical protein